MSEKTIAARIKMARKMAGMNTQAALLKKIPHWKPSRLGNYEASISIPKPEDILQIAKATESSPCWLMFGIGPIRPNARDLQAIRHQNLCNSYEELKQQSRVGEFAKALGLDKKTLVNEYINNPFMEINDDMAHFYEDYLDLPKGWMDEQHIEQDPLCLSFPEDIRELMSLFSSLNPTGRVIVLETVKTLVTKLQNK